MRSLGITIVVALAAAACASDGRSASSARVRVVSTVSPITNLVQNIGCDRIDVSGIVPEGTNSHTFEPAPSDARVIAGADVVFVNGLHLEEPTVELAEAHVGEGVPIIRLGERTLPPEEYIYDFSFPEEQGDPNPHTWTNPLYAKEYAETIRNELSRMDPESADSFHANYERLAARMDELDLVVRRVTETVPPEHRKLLTYHDSFPYFAREYGWEIIGAIQPSDFSDPTPRDVVALIDQIRQEDVPAIFGSEVFPSPVLEQIAAETGTRYVDDLRDDDLPGENGDPDHSYWGLMTFDFQTFMGALGGEPSPFDALPVENLCGESSATYRT